MRKRLYAVLSMCVVAAGCAKAKPLTQVEQQANLVTVMAKAIVISAPDNSYTARQAADVKTSGSNFQALMTNYVNPIALPLKEVISHLGETAEAGTRTEGSLRVALDKHQSLLTGAANNDGAEVKWTYKVGAYDPLFTGTAQISGLKGALHYGIAGLSVGMTVTWEIVSDASGAITRKLTVVNPTSGNIEFTAKIDTSGNAGAVTFQGRVAAGTFSGSWDPKTGGFFIDPTSTKKCFDATLADLAVCI